MTSLKFLFSTSHSFFRLRVALLSVDSITRVIPVLAALGIGARFNLKHQGIKVAVQDEREKLQTDDKLDCCFCWRCFRFGRRKFRVPTSQESFLRNFFAGVGFSVIQLFILFKLWVSCGFTNNHNRTNAA